MEPVTDCKDGHSGPFISPVRAAAFSDRPILTGVSIFVIPREVLFGGANYGGEGNRGRRYAADIGPFEF